MVPFGFSKAMVPVSGSRRPAIMDSKVDLPHPLGPTIETNTKQILLLQQKMKYDEVQKSPHSYYGKTVLHLLILR